jgi:alcohol dehydrogenase (cytochrome c)/quinohemoprotein ethanol dehydrogenase
MVAVLITAGCDGQSSDGVQPPDPTNPVSTPRAAAVTVERLLGADADTANWMSYGRTHDEQRFSPLTGVNDTNVGQLGLAWWADLDTLRGQEATSLAIDGVLYVSTAWSMVKAYDAATGKLLWSYDPQVPRQTLVKVCCDAVNRGVAALDGRIYVATLDGRLVALDAATGRPVWEKRTFPADSDYAITGAPRIVKGRVLIGSSGAEYVARGWLSAYDAATGDEVWRFYTVPGDPAKGFENAAMEAAAKTWSGEWWKHGGGGTVWDSIAYDPALNLVIFGTANGEPWNPAVRSPEGGDNLYTSSLVAVDADTGEYRWHFQETPRDRWDYDSNQSIILADLPIDGQSRRVVLHAPKNGFFYVLDAASGQFISGAPFAQVNWARGLDPQTGYPEFNPEAFYDVTGKPFIALPGFFGAHSWQPMSFSPKTGLAYIPVNEAGTGYAPAAAGWSASGIGMQLGVDSSQVAMPADTAVREQFKAATTGALLAWNPVTQQEAWRVPYEGPWNGGTLATAGNLVFQGTAAGNFLAYRADTGAQLWSYPVQTGVIAAPMSYSVNGEQYVAILAGWGGVWDLVAGVLADKSGTTRNISRLLVFKLGATGALPEPPPLKDMVLDPPPVTGTSEQITAGNILYHRYCFPCHGDAAVAGGLVPDLRHSGAINSAATMKGIVVDGALQHRGMVSFGVALDEAAVESIRHYVIQRANEDKALEAAGT